MLLLFYSIISGSGRTNAYHHCPAFAASPNTQAAEAEHSSGRRWKNKRKRQTFLPSPSRQVSAEEEVALLDQLGYVPPNICAISARSGKVDISSADEIETKSAIDTSSKGIGRPIAIQSYPLLVQIVNKEENKLNRTPFPTMYWLTCPHVSRAISEIERNGYVRKFQSKLEDDASLAREWWRCHEEYASERWELLSESDREWLLSTNQHEEEDSAEQRKVDSMREMIQYSGVAGTDHRRLRESDDEDKKNNDSYLLFVPSVKCLHSHYAHYRSQGEDETAVINIVGKWTHELLLEEFPDLII